MNPLRQKPERNGWIHRATALLAAWPTRARGNSWAADARSVVEACPGATLAIDTAGRIVHANAEAATLLGVTVGELAGRAAGDFLVGAAARVEVDLVAQLRQHAQRHAPGACLPARLVGRSGAEVTVDVAVRAPGETADGALICVLADTSAYSNRIRAERNAASQLRDALLETERRAAELRTLVELGELLQSCSLEPDVHAVASHGGARLFPQLSGRLYAIGEGGGDATLASSWGEPLAGIDDTFAPSACWALRRGRLHLAEGTAAHLRCAHLHDAVQAHACVPVQAHGETLGVLTLCAVDPEALASALAPARQLLATAFAEQAGLAVANLRLREALRTQSLRDPLTGLYNRRFVDEWLERELLRARRQGETVSVLMMDLDHFKQFNDTYGHESGDAALRDVGALMLGSVRASDIACRLGGEELALMLPNTATDGAVRLAEKLRATVADMIVLCRGQERGRLTISIGVATFPRDGATPDDLLHAADMALYRAKAEGRDRVCTAHPGTSPWITAATVQAPGPPTAAISANGDTTEDADLGKY
jgi:diguanylate cyclase (GGDEF)-like protein